MLPMRFNGEKRVVYEKGMVAKWESKGDSQVGKKYETANLYFYKYLLFLGQICSIFR